MPDHSSRFSFTQKYAPVTLRWTGR